MLLKAPGKEIFMEERTGKEYQWPGKGISIIYEDAYEEFKKKYAAEYCYCVYILTSPEEKLYIGYCRGNPLHRWQNGKGYRKNKALSAAIRDFGWENFRKQIYREELNIDEARELERILILTYESWNPEFGYNRAKPKEYEDLMHYSVYQLITPDDRKMYVGYTGEPFETRWANGYGYRDNQELYEAIQRVGWENVIKIRCVENVLEDSAKAFEAYLIEVNHTTDPARGYNKSKSGEREHGWKRSEESMANTRAANRGIQRSEAQKERYRQCKANISYPVWCEETQTSYLSVREAARQLGIPKTTLARYLDAGKEECRGYHLKFCRQLQNENEQPLKPI